MSCYLHIAFIYLLSYWTKLVILSMEKNVSLILAEMDSLGLDNPYIRIHVVMQFEPIKIGWIRF